MKHRSSSRDTRQLKRKHNKSGSVKYDSSSDERLSPPEAIRRRRSPSSPPRFSGYEKTLRDSSYRSSKEPDKSYASYKVLCVSALHSKASDDVIKDILYNEYKKFGDLSVRISHDLDERVAYVCFRNADDAREAKYNKPRVIIYDKVALVEAVYESSNRSPTERYRERDYSRQRSRSYSPPAYERHRRTSPLPTANDLFRSERYYDRLPPYAPLPIPPRDYPRDIPIHPDFLARPPLHPAALPPPHLPLAPHLYGLPRPFLPFKPFLPQYFDKYEKRDRFPNYLHHVPPEDDPLATRTLFVGNLELPITDEELRRTFSRYGVVEDVDIKRPVPGTGNAYAFVRFKNLDMAHRAKVELSGQYIGKFQCKIGYGKAMPTTRIWVGGLGPWTSIAQLEREFDRFGAIKKIDYDKPESCAYIQYDSVDAASAAVKEMRGFPLGGSDHKLRVDFADIGSRHSKSSHFDESESVLSSGGGGDYHRQKQLDREHLYDSYESPWHSTEYGYERRRSSLDNELNAASERKYEKSSSQRNRNSSSEDVSKDAKDWKTDYKPSTSSQNNSEDDDRSSEQNTNNNSDGGGTEFVINQARSLSEISKKCAVLWHGAFLLKNSIYPTDFYLLDGNKDVISSLMADTQLMKITQRLRMDETKLDDVTKKMGNSNSYAIILSLSSSSSVNTNDSSMQLKSLKNLITYLTQKEAAGVVTLTTKDNPVTGILYAFPPGEFSTDLLKKCPCNLSSDGLKEDYVVVVVVKDIK